MYTGLNNLGLNAISKAFSPQALFMNNEPGFHGETYDPNSLLRRTNFVTYSQQFDNAIWIKANSSVTVNGSEFKLVEAATNTSHNIACVNASVVGSTAVAVARLKAGERTWAAVGLGTHFAFFDIQNGTVGVTTAGSTASIAAVSDDPGYFDCTLSVATVGGGSGSALIYSCFGDNQSVYLGDGTSGIYMRRMQVNRNTTTAQAYQLVTDWNTEYVNAALGSIAMWQESTGSTAVTAVEQPVGMWMDTKQKTVGPEMVVNGDFSSDTWWTKGTDWVISGGVASRGASAASSNLSRPNLFTLGKCYRVIVEITALTGTCIVYAGGSAFQTYTTPGRKVAHLRCAGDTTLYIQASGAASTVTVDNVSAKEIPGNHAIQATSSARPTLSALYNQFFKSEQFDDAYWSKTEATVVANTVTAPNGLQVADTLTDNAVNNVHRVLRSVSITDVGCRLSVCAKAGTKSNVNLFVIAGAGFCVQNFRLSDGTIQAQNISGSTTPVCTPSITSLGNGWYRCMLDVTLTVAATSHGFDIAPNDSATSAYIGDGTGTIHLWGADLRTANDVALRQPVYQRVNTSTDYDSSGFVHYLRFDGVDDCLQTPSIDFSTTDKMTVWTGMTKISDPASAIIGELTAAAGSFDGAFFVASAINAFSFALRGTVVAASWATTTTYPAPLTEVITAAFDTAGATQPDQIKIRFNGSVYTTPIGGTTTAGNFANAVLNIGARNAGSLYLTGRMTTFTTRGALTSAVQVKQMEQYDAQKAGQTFVSS